MVRKALSAKEVLEEAIAGSHQEGADHRIDGMDNSMLENGYMKKTTKGGNAPL